MPTTEANDRVRLVFSLFDADGNGYLEPSDFELMGKRTVAALPAAGEKAAARLLDAFRRYGDTLLSELDADGDGRVSPEEFTAVVLDPRRFDAAVDEFADALSTMGDVRGDGFVARPDFLALMTAIGFDRPNIEALFEVLGPVDGDRVPVAVWADAIRDYYRPEKAGIAGDRLVSGTAR
ncbi:calcium-binding protein [Streptomyces cinereoruber]|uniref:Calcium-binding protein n=1 Tax=Streptomyces cinereoruber TaxID=67260 RepID=A0AAV4KF44_9ACTN|nr:Ca2+-binding EF-hand superfamily protein [Streptomyces cinereoruber]MBY8819810.1 EF-hand domain-containing protein [Streptomyces cinereoruber]NIH63654.1 Ca2+-binding EF-hand superfamily protein [Streptomyces cinereoruber]QEV36269.1 calcium-binding protein [Streptomyces cinereoruber]GGR11774.1 calcium-binding protein [Streptomyces cinereoruber]